MDEYSHDYCAFSKDHRCIKWSDYELTRQQLEEADVLCHGNWIEIKRLRGYIAFLQNLLEYNGIQYPSEWGYEFEQYEVIKEPDALPFD